MKKKMTIWGIGGTLAVRTVPFLGASIALHYLVYPIFVIEIFPVWLLRVAGTGLILIGIFVWLSSVLMVTRGFGGGKLVTTGIYAYFRHPLYAAFIDFILPGVALLFPSWIVMTTPVFMYVIFRLKIKEEENFLERKFGQVFHDYKRRVHAVCPTFKRYED